jgi:hypothetical protein
MATKQKIDAQKHYLARRTVSLSDGTVLHVAERRSGIDPVVQAHAAEFVAEGTKTPQELAAEEAAAGERLMRAARDASGYYGRPEVGGGIKVEQKQRVVFVAADSYVDIGSGTELLTQGTVLDANDRRVKALPAENFRPFQEVFGSYLADAA